MKRICLVFLLATTFLGAQALGPRVTQQKLELGECSVGQEVESVLTLQNSSLISWEIDSVDLMDSHLYQTARVSSARTLPFLLGAQSIDSLALRFMIRHNVRSSGYVRLFVHSACQQQVLSVPYSFNAHHSAVQYTDNREYQELYDSLRTHVVNHNSLGYKPAREVMFGKADNVNDSVECIYTGKKLKTVGIPPNGEFNTEHTWVQSRGSSVEPNKSDINHLYPTNPNANSLRANYPFGVVSKVWKDVGGGSYLGFTAQGDTVFEPRDLSKGNIARSIFYYLVRYGNLTDYYTSPYRMDHDLRMWNAMDPPDARERQRCDTIAAYQGKRNPFVDYSELAERIDFVETQHDAQLRVVETTIVVAHESDSADLQLHLVNRSATAKHVNSVMIQPAAELQLVKADTAQDIPSHSDIALQLRYNRNQTVTLHSYTCIITATDGSADTMHFNVCAEVSVEEPVVQKTTTIIPQPIHDRARIQVCSTQKPLCLSVYSLLGEKLCDIIGGEEINASVWEYQLETSRLNIAKGSYMLRIQHSNGVETQLCVVQ